MKYLTKNQLGDIIKDDKYLNIFLVYSLYKDSGVIAEMEYAGDAVKGLINFYFNNKDRVDDLKRHYYGHS